MSINELEIKRAKLYSELHKLERAAWVAKVTEDKEFAAEVDEKQKSINVLINEIDKEIVAIRTGRRAKVEKAKVLREIYMDRRAAALSELEVKKHAFIEDIYFEEENEYLTPSTIESLYRDYKRWDARVEEQQHIIDTDGIEEGQDETVEEKNEELGRMFDSEEKRSEVDSYIKSYISCGCTVDEIAAGLNDSLPRDDVISYVNSDEFKALSSLCESLYGKVYLYDEEKSVNSIDVQEIEKMYESIGNASKPLFICVKELCDHVKTAFAGLDRNSIAKGDGRFYFATKRGEELRDRLTERFCKIMASVHELYFGKYNNLRNAWDLESTFSWFKRSTKPRLPLDELSRIGTPGRITPEELRKYIISEKIEDEDTLDLNDRVYDWKNRR